MKIKYDIKASSCDMTGPSWAFTTSSIHFQAAMITGVSEVTMIEVGTPTTHPLEKSSPHQFFFVSGNATTTPGYLVNCDGEIG